MAKYDEVILHDSKDEIIDRFLEGKIDPKFDWLLNRDAAWDYLMTSSNLIEMDGGKIVEVG